MHAFPDPHGFKRKPAPKLFARTIMNAAHESYSGEFRPGDWVTVIDGTFVGSAGRVIDAKEAREMWERDGGQQPAL